MAWAWRCRVDSPAEVFSGNVYTCPLQHSCYCAVISVIFGRYIAVVMWCSEVARCYGLCLLMLLRCRNGLRRHSALLWRCSGMFRHAHCVALSGSNEASNSADSQRRHGKEESMSSLLLLHMWVPQSPWWVVNPLTPGKSSMQSCQKLSDHSRLH